MVIKLPGREKQIKLIFIFLGVILVFVLVLYFGLNPGGISFTGGEEISLVPKVKKSAVSNIKLNLEILTDSRFKSLKYHGELPVKIPESLGRTNPFIPY